MKTKNKFFSDVTLHGVENPNKKQVFDFEWKSGKIHVFFWFLRPGKPEIPKQTCFFSPRKTSRKPETQRKRSPGFMVLSFGDWGILCFFVQNVQKMFLHTILCS